eukprot:3478597-Rhodomonas_salina.1
MIVWQQTGKIHEKCLHINCVGISEDETFKIGRGMERSDEVQLLDLYAPYSQLYTNFLSIEDMAQTCLKIERDPPVCRCSFSANFCSLQSGAEILLQWHGRNDRSGNYIVDAAGAYMMERLNE